VYVAFGANPCPAKTAQIVDEETCQTAAFAAGVSLRVETDRRRPKGCYTATSATIAETNMSFVFNSDPMGLAMTPPILVTLVNTGCYAQSRPVRPPGSVRAECSIGGTQGSATLVRPVPLRGTGKR
jgi:hypothetical protein